MTPAFPKDFKAIGVQTFSVPYGLYGEFLVNILPDTKNELARILFSGGCRRKRIAIFFHYHHPFFNRPAQFLIHRGFVIAMNTAQHQSGTDADIAVVCIRPFYDFQIPVAYLHFFTSPMAMST